ncbi:MAG: ROK family protein, partial [Oscillospiraceae bacterium]|nr:ROK family protein [Oscillospiraceae bacterium]
MGGRRCVSVDLGGTKISAALVDDGYAMLTDCNVATNAKEGVDAVIGRINACIRKVCDDGGVKASDLCGIGICSPGPLSVRTGTVTYVATLGWYGVPIKAILEGEFGVPVSLENDANAAALGEALMGAGKGMENVVYITLSTGIGSGIVIGGKVYYGKNEAAGE